MNQKSTQFGQALQLAELRQQVAELQEQNAKLATEVKVLRESDRALFDAQEAMIDGLQTLLREYHEFNKYDAPQLRANYRAWDAERNVLQEHAQALLAEKES